MPGGDTNRGALDKRLGEIRDRRFEQERYRASGLNQVTAVDCLRNTVYLEREAHSLRGYGDWRGKFTPSRPMSTV